MGWEIRFRWVVPSLADTTSILIKSKPVPPFNKAQQLWPPIEQRFVLQKEEASYRNSALAVTIHCDRKLTDRAHFPVERMQSNYVEDWGCETFTSDHQEKKNGMMSFFARTITETKSGHTTIVLFCAWSQKSLEQISEQWCFSDRISGLLLTWSCFLLNPEGTRDKQNLFISCGNDPHWGLSLV